MSTAYKFTNPDGIYFLSFATVDWVDVFIRRVYHEIVLNSLRHCIDHKGMQLHAWCVMTNHIHLLISRSGNVEFSAIIRDMKKYTSGMLLKAIREENESRKE